MYSKMPKVITALYMACMCVMAYLKCISAIIAANYSTITESDTMPTQIL